MSRARFQEVAAKRVTAVLEDMGSRFAGNMWWGVVKPLVNVARPQLERAITEEPDEVHRWLVFAKSEIDAALEAWDEPEAP